MSITELAAGFADPVLASQSVFRTIMDAMARPGSIQRIAAASGTPSPLMRGSAALALALFDHDTPIWLDKTMAEAGEVARWLKFHTGAPLTSDPSAASFALIGAADALPSLDSFALGTAEYPDRSTTLIIQVAGLGAGEAFRLQGPGIKGETQFQASLQTADLFDRLAVNATLFPRGIDVVLVDDDRIVAIPRTTRLVEGD
ncbi:phosphonate C-P lyase system protein PhnH [Rhodopseudomonas sp. B29]|uniref:phosphonate C-P lyase system protein PhnH n=1 Tax=Rhodopseudomonas sp. B29 TaxID=95607 RepID=UPI000349A2FA|nr:phosphonate C-P lyase system protein PhnH [Rhodopseudomonas sp. B29]